MFMFSFLVGLFPKSLPKPIEPIINPEDGVPQYPKYTPAITEKTLKDEIPLARNPFSLDVAQVPQEAIIENSSNVGAAFSQPDGNNFPTMKGTQTYT